MPARGEVEADVHAIADYIASTVKTYINSPIPDALKGGAFTTVLSAVAGVDHAATVLVRDRLDRKALPIHLMTLFGNTGGWHPANPGIKRIKERLASTYLQLTQLPPDQSHEKVANYAPSPTDSTLFRLFFERNSAIVGERGVGKTSLFNFWTSIYGRDLLEKRHLTWFRVDATKVYRLWRDNNLAKHSVTIGDYHKVHLLIVYLIYAGIISYKKFNRQDDVIPSRLFQSLHDKLKNGQDAVSDAYRSSLPNINQYLFADGRVVDLIDRLKQNPRIDISDELVRILLLTDNASFKHHVQDLYATMVEALNLQNIRVVVVVDGADNIGLHRQQELYKQMISQLGHFAEHLETETRLQNCGFMILTRPETIPDLVRQMGRGRLDYNNTHWNTFRQTVIFPPRLGDILNKKIEAIASADAFDQDRASCVLSYNRSQESDRGAASLKLISEQTVASAVRQLIPIKDEFLTGIRNSIEAVFRSAIDDARRNRIVYFPKFQYEHLTEARIVSEIFNNNVRSFIDNFLETYGLREFFHQMNIIGSYRQDRMLQYMLLDGRIFLNSQSSWDRRRNNDGIIHRIRRGETFPNIFWFDHQVHKENDPSRPLQRWHGLTNIRLLQVLDFLSGMPVSACDVLLLLHRIFEYDTRILRQSLENMIAFGLITVDVIHGQEPIYDANADFADYKEVVGITPKGRFYLEFPFIFPDWFYQCALDTPIYNELAKSSRYMRCHREIDEFSAMGNYLDAFVISTSTFAKIICEHQASELSLAQSKLHTFSNEFGALINDANRLINHHLSLPSAFEPMVYETARRFARGRGTDRNGLRELERDVKGAFEYAIYKSR